MDEEHWRRLNGRAKRNHGIIGPADLAWAEIPASTFSRFARQHGCTQRHRGCWTLPQTPWTFECQVACALAVVGAHAYITGEAGLHLLGVQRRRPSTVELLVAVSRSGRGRQGVTVRRTTRMDDIRTTSAKGFTVASVEQCLVDASRVHPESLLAKSM